MGKSRLKRLMAFLMAALMVFSLVMPSRVKSGLYIAFANNGEGDIASDSDAELDTSDSTADIQPVDLEETKQKGEAAESDKGKGESSDVTSDKLSSNKTDARADEKSDDKADKAGLNKKSDSAKDEDAKQEETTEAFVNNVTSYHASSDGLSVTALPSRPEVFPEGTKLVITPLVSGAGYDAYINALGDKATENGKLYDIAFIYEDEDGTHEYEPEEGNVSMSFSFSDAVLKAIGADSAQSVEVTHLPLLDGVKNDGDRTIDVPVTAGDILVEDVDITSAGSKSLSFSADSFSSYYIADDGTETTDVNNASKKNLANFVNDVVLKDGDTQITSDPWVVRADKEYGMTLSFAENPVEGGIQFDIDTGTFTYVFPEGIKEAGNPNDKFSIDVIDKSENEYRVEDKTYK